MSIRDAQIAAAQHWAVWYGPTSAEDRNAVLERVAAGYPHSVRLSMTYPTLSVEWLKILERTYGPEGIVRLPGPGSPPIPADDPGRWVLLAIDLGHENPHSSAIRYAYDVYFCDQNDAFEFKMAHG